MKKRQKIELTIKTIHNRTYTFIYRETNNIISLKNDNDSF